MMKPRGRFVASLVIFTAVLTLACSRGPEEPVSEPDVYQTRGIVRQIGQPPKVELYIHHEAIPDFADEEGKVVGMDSMAMPFPVADTQLAQDLAVGDRIGFRFEVHWSGNDPLRLVAVEKLSPETRLDFETLPEETEEEAADGVDPESGMTEP